MSAERWLPVVGYEGRYEVSNLGRVRVVFSSKHTQIGMLVGSTKNTGYREAALVDSDGARKYVRIHKMVLLAFVGPPPSGMECNHKNGIKTDNRLENLEWVTKSEQHIHRARVLNHHPRGECLARRGERNGGAKIGRLEAEKIREWYAFGTISQQAIADFFGLNQAHVSRIIRRSNW